jgi:adenine-specific DNA-methyltransferase
VAANSLIGLPIPEPELFIRSLIEPIEKEIEACYHRHFAVQNRKQKGDLQDKIKSLRLKLADTIVNGLGAGKNAEIIKKAKHIADWDPFDPQSSADFFDSHWMFGRSLKDGFDVVIGNPPYIKEYTYRKAFDCIRILPYYQGKMDIWYFFACLALDQLRTKHGVLTFIATNNWVTNAGASILRNKIVSSARISQLLDFGEYKIFENADIQTMILVCRPDSTGSRYFFDLRSLRGSSPSYLDVIDLLNKAPNAAVEYLTPEFDRATFRNKPFTFSNDTNNALLEKIAQRRNFLLDGDKEVAQGLVAPQDSVNKASQKNLGDEFDIGDGIFVLTQEEKDAIGFTEYELALIRPFYTTTELGKHYGDCRNRFWVIYTDSSFKDPNKIRPYPNIKRHLDQFREVITSHNWPYGLHRARDCKFFRGEKIVSVRKCAEPQFSYTDFDCYVSQTFNVIKTSRANSKYLVGLLNSALIAFWLKHQGKMQGHQYQVDKEPLLNIPIYCPSLPNQQTIIDFVDRILAAKKANPASDTTAFERQIDQQVYNHYGLTPEEIAIVEGTVK